MHGILKTFKSTFQVSMVHFNRPRCREKKRKVLSGMPSCARLSVPKLHLARKVGSLFLHPRPGVMAWYLELTIQRKKGVCGGS